MDLADFNVISTRFGIFPKGVWSIIISFMQEIDRSQIKLCNKSFCTIVKKLCITDTYYILASKLLTESIIKKLNDNVSFITDKNIQRYIMTGIASTQNIDIIKKFEKKSYFKNIDYTIHLLKNENISCIEYFFNTDLDVYYQEKRIPIKYSIKTIDIVLNFCHEKGIGIFKLDNEFSFQNFISMTTSKSKIFHTAIETYLKLSVYTDKNETYTNHSLVDDVVKFIEHHEENNDVWINIFFFCYSNDLELFMYLFKKIMLCELFEIVRDAICNNIEYYQNLRLMHLFSECNLKMKTTHVLKFLEKICMKPETELLEFFKINNIITAICDFFYNTNCIKDDDNTMDITKNTNKIVNFLLNNKYLKLVKCTPIILYFMNIHNFKIYIKYINKTDDSCIIDNLKWNEYYVHAIIRNDIDVVNYCQPFVNLGIVLENVPINHTSVQIFGNMIKNNTSINVSKTLDNFIYRTIESYKKEHVKKLLEIIDIHDICMLNKLLLLSCDNFGIKTMKYLIRLGANDIDGCLRKIFSYQFKIDCNKVKYLLTIRKSKEAPYLDISGTYIFHFNRKILDLFFDGVVKEINMKYYLCDKLSNYKKLLKLIRYYGEDFYYKHFKKMHHIAAMAMGGTEANCKYIVKNYLIHMKFDADLFLKYFNKNMGLKIKVDDFSDINYIYDILFMNGLKKYDVFINKLWHYNVIFDSDVLFHLINTHKICAQYIVKLVCKFSGFSNFNVRKFMKLLNISICPNCYRKH